MIVTSSSDAKLEIARKLGAKYGVNYKTNTDWEKEVLKMVSPIWHCLVIPSIYCIGLSMHSRLAMKG